MIESIKISSCASFNTTGVNMAPLKKVNFIFGANGSGKTTLSRLIADEQAPEFSNSSIDWEADLSIQTRVYNSDFKDKTLRPDEDIPGVFTLGENNIDIEQQIRELNNQIDEKETAIRNLKRTLEGENGSGGKLAERENLKSGFYENCWEVKRRHENVFSEAFRGSSRGKKDFADRILKEATENNAKSSDLEELTHKASMIFSDTPQNENKIAELDTTSILALEQTPILTKRVVGKEDVDISAMIERLGNSDWVRQGIQLFNKNEGYCPFCQQKAPDILAKNLEDFFDESYSADIDAIEKLSNEYETYSSDLISILSSLIERQCPHLNTEVLKSETDLLKSKIELNRQRIDEKYGEPSHKVELESLTGILRDISSRIADANLAIEEHNTLIQNLEREKITLTNEVWRYLLDNEVSAVLQSYNNSLRGIESGIQSLQMQIEQKRQEVRQCRNEVNRLERKITSIQPTVDSMNEMLTTFGFSGFHIEAAENDATYKLIRSDGNDARSRLSEGEKTFVTFLYFYQTLFGSSDTSGITQKRIVVFDDPISSLDSDILFIVGALVKEVIDKACDESSNILQVFILTHNVYFHREVTFSSNRCQADPFNHETFWTVRKRSGVSILDKHEKNPITTAYQLLWEEAKREDHNVLTIQNTLRRILENYFKILGMIKPEDIWRRFEGRDQIVCRSLFRWVNEGSHFALGDDCITADSGEVEVYLNVFKEIFNKLGHEAHYTMMMGESPSEG